MNIKRTAPGHYSGFAFYGLFANITRQKTDGWDWRLSEGRNGEDKIAGGNERTKTAAIEAIRKYGRDETVVVHNMMSGKPLTLSLDQAGGPCDPSTERYWSM